MSIVVDRSFGDCLFPDNLPRIEIQAKQFHRVTMIGSDAIGVKISLSFVIVIDRLCARDNRTLDCGGEKDSVSPHDWRRVASTRNCSFPTNVFGIAPFGWNTRL